MWCKMKIGGSQYWMKIHRNLISEFRINQKLINNFKIFQNNLSAAIINEK